MLSRKFYKKLQVRRPCLYYRSYLFTSSIARLYIIVYMYLVLIGKGSREKLVRIISQYWSGNLCISLKIHTENQMLIYTKQWLNLIFITRTDQTVSAKFYHTCSAKKASFARVTKTTVISDRNHYFIWAKFFRV